MKTEGINHILSINEFSVAVHVSLHSISEVPFFLVPNVLTLTVTEMKTGWIKMVDERAPCSCQQHVSSRPRVGTERLTTRPDACSTSVFIRASLHKDTTQNCCCVLNSLLCSQTGGCETNTRSSFRPPALLSTSLTSPGSRHAPAGPRGLPGPQTSS